jgi:hypothetical protein
MSRNKSLTWSDQHHGPHLQTANYTVASSPPMTASAFPIEARSMDEGFRNDLARINATLVELNAVKRTADGFAHVDVDKVPPELMTEYSHLVSLGYADGFFEEATR